MATPLHRTQCPERNVWSWFRVYMLIFFSTSTYTWKILLFFTFHRVDAPFHYASKGKSGLKIQEKAELVFFAEESFLMLIFSVVSWSLGYS